LPVFVYTDSATVPIVAEFGSKNWKRRCLRVLPYVTRAKHSSHQFSSLGLLSFTCSVWEYSWGRYFPCVIFRLQKSSIRS